MGIIKHRKIFYLLSIALVLISFVLLFVFGLKPSIDFTGGSMIEVSYNQEIPNQEQVEEIIFDSGYKSAVIRHSGENGYFIKLPTVTNVEKNDLVSKLGSSDNISEKQFTTVGPTLGKELTTKASVALILVIFAIVAYVAYVFRAVSKPVSSWKYGLVAIIALIHDVLITLGFFALIGVLLGVEIDTLFVTALLVILGYSVNDSIVVLDRVRENLQAVSLKIRKKDFAEIVGKSLRETIARSINTSITTLLALAALYMIGGEVTRNFSLALIVGVIAGAYSSIFLAAPLLVTFKNTQKEKKEDEKENEEGGEKEVA